MAFINFNKDIYLNMAKVLLFFPDYLAHNYDRQWRRHCAIWDSDVTLENTSYFRFTL